MLLTHPLADGAELGMLEPWHAQQFLDTLDKHREYLKPEVAAANLVFTLEESQQTLRRWADAHAADTGRLFGIWRDATLIGCVQVFDFNAVMGTCELGVWLVPDAQGRGLITDACRSIIDWAIRVRGLTRVQWGAQPSNERSVAVARRLGMTREGVLRSNWQVGGVRHDSEVWSVLADEWPTA